MKLGYQTDQGIGTAATFGVVVLETDETLEKEFSQIFDHADVALYHTRVPMVPEITQETLSTMKDALPNAAKLLPSAAQFDVIGYGCTSAATVIGSNHVAAALNSVKPEARITDPLAAAKAACRHLEIRRLGLVTPYVRSVSDGMIQRLEEDNIQISAFGSFEEGDDRVVARITPASLQEAALSVGQSQNCDGVFISCTNLRCLDIIAETERLLSRPVLSSNQVLAWDMLRLAGHRLHRPEFGQLFSEH